jgi:CheY-like chemotaxis protein
VIREETIMAGEEILVIEDEPQWQRELRRILEAGGLKVSIAGSYPEAIHAFKQATAKVAVIDVSLIKGDPFDRQGKELMKVAKIPVVCISGYLEPAEAGDVVAQQQAAWFFDKGEWLEKPKEFEQKFIQAVKSSLVRSEAEIHERWREIERRLRPGD